MDKEPKKVTNRLKDKTEETRLIWFVVLSAVTITLWGVIFPPNNNLKEDSVANKQNSNKTEKIINIKTSNSISKINNKDEKKDFEDKDKILKKTSKHRVKINNSGIIGSINLRGLSIDNVELKDYKENRKTADLASILSPRSTKDAYFITIGWIPIEGIDEKDMPNSETIWKSDHKELLPEQPITLQYSNKSGQDFQVRLSIDDKYMLSAEQLVVNKSNHIIQVNPFITIIGNKDKNEKSSDSYQGPLGLLDDQFQEISYKKLTKNDFNFQDQENSWAGLSKKYWLIGINTPNKSNVKIKTRALYEDTYQTKIIIQKKAGIIKGKHSSVSSSNVFIGPKKITILENYSKNYNMRLFSRAIDLGKLYFLTKPILLLLTSINFLFNNYGMSIIIMTIIIRICLIPLARKSHVAMEKIKSISPQIAKLKEIYKEKKELDMEIFNLYKREKINPLASIFPLLIQIPIFFALYKALYVSIELRHSIFIKGWIDDLSAPDPTSLVNLFGLLHFKVPGGLEFISIGILPILMGFTMWLQQRASGSLDSINKEQAQIMKYLPILFTFLFANFPSGLVLYWVITNTFSIFQDRIMKKKSKELI